MEFVATVLAKTQSGAGEFLALKLEFNGEELKFQGQAFTPTVKVEEALFNAVKLEDQLFFIHNDTVHGIAV